MIVGLGTDLVEVARVEEALQRFGDRFSRRILVPAELQKLHASARPGSYLARRWAAKEAASKSLGTGIGAGVSWQDFVIMHDDSGAPRLQLSGQAALLADQLGVVNTLLSISDERNYALAFVVLESRSN